MIYYFAGRLSGLEEHRVLLRSTVGAGSGLPVTFLSHVGEDAVRSHALKSPAETRLQILINIAQ